MFTAEFPPYPGGIATYSYEIAAAATRLGHEIVVFNFSRPSGLATTFEVESCRPHAYENYKFPWASLNIQIALARRPFDMVFAADLKDIVACALVRTRCEKRAAVHGTDVRSKFLVKYLARLYFKPLQYYNRIFANSRFTRSLLVSTHKYLPPQRCQVAPLGVDRFWFEPTSAQDREALSRRLGRTGRFVAATVGRLERRKGQLQTIRAVRRLPDTIRDNVTLLIVGATVENDYAAELAKEAEAAGADVRLLGDIPKAELRALYGACDLLVHTATEYGRRVEGFGLVLLEAAAAGVPTLATRIDALPEVVVEGTTGLLVADGDLEGISEAISYAYANDLKSKFGEQCKRVASEYTWDRCASIAFA